MGSNAIMFYMMEEGMRFEGAVRVMGNVPCTKCGHGDLCDMSGIKMLFGPNATTESVGINIFENQQNAVTAATELGKRIAQALSEK
jgi:hypothetical protein